MPIKSLNMSPVETCQTDEGLDVCAVLWRWKFLNDFTQVLHAGIDNVRIASRRWLPGYRTVRLR